MNQHAHEMLGLAGLDAATVQRAIEVGRLVHVPADWTPMRAQEPADEVYFVLEGEVRIVAHDESIADLGPGSFFGEMGVVDHALRSARVTARRPVLAIAWPREDFEELRRTYADLNELVTTTTRDRRAENAQRAD